MVRSRHIDQPVKPSRTKNRRINNVRPVRSTNNDNIDQRLYPVQLPNTQPAELLWLLQTPLNSLLKLLFNISKPPNVRPRHRRHLDVDLPHRGRRDLPIRVREILNVDLHLLQDATGNPFFLEIDLWKIPSQRFHRSLTTERRNVRPRVAVANIRQPVKIHIRSQWHGSRVNL